MKRRSFVKASVLASSLPAILKVNNATAAATKKTTREYYELRTYSLKNTEQQVLTESYLQKALIPACNKLGSKNIGVFTELKPEGQTRIFVLIPFKSIEDFTEVNIKLLKDEVYVTSAADYLNAPATAPAYERIESSLLLAFEGMPLLQAPANKPRIFELRRYESHSEAAGIKKIEMFNSAGEIPIFRRTGLTPVFFGECLIGSYRPNLTYMLVFDDMADHDKSWKTFGSDAEWKKISGKPEYADAKIISKITSTFLAPTSYSQF